MHGRGRRATWRAADGSPRVRRLVWCEGAWNAAVKLEFLRVLCLRRDVQTLVNGLVF